MGKYKIMSENELQKVANRVNSSALMADAWHHRSDALSSIGALVGIGGARLGFPRK